MDIFYIAVVLAFFAGLCGLLPWLERVRGQV